MIHYSPVPLGFFSLIRNCFAAYPNVLARTWKLILLAVFLHTTIGLLVYVNPAIGLMGFVLFVLIFSFIYIILMTYTDKLLLGLPADYHTATAIAKKRYLPFLGGYLAYFLIMLVLLVIAYGFNQLGGYLESQIHIAFLYESLTVFGIILIMIAVILFYFLLPVLSLKNYGVRESFELSIRYVWRDMWRIIGITLVLLGIYFAILVVLAIIVSSRDIIALSALGFLTEFLAFPFIVIAPLILLHDAELRS